jgi:hypothetical protein
LEGSINRLTSPDIFISPEGVEGTAKRTTSPYFRSRLESEYEHFLSVAALPQITDTLN